MAYISCTLVGRYIVSAARMKTFGCEDVVIVLVYRQERAKEK